jgi:hypothetical protein
VRLRYARVDARNCQSRGKLASRLALTDWNVAPMS